MPTGPEEVEAMVARVATIIPESADEMDVVRLLEAVEFLHNEYRWMHRCFLLATNPHTNTQEV